jgi:hypothetical protein
MRCKDEALVIIRRDIQIKHVIPGRAERGEGNTGVSAFSRSRICNDTILKQIADVNAWVPFPRREGRRAGDDRVGV